ncbi:MAG: flavin reductase family protein [Anaerolineaceae bacterium]|nr:flavin reductase family protein [Anaerolineaceae bacterium]
MANSPIAIEELKLNSFSIFQERWFVLMAGDFAEKKYNCMTISWGSLGVIWEKPFVMVAVRPTRYTFQFIQQYPDFTVCAFPTECHKALEYLGSKSGRREDKIAKSGLTACAAEKVAAPAFAEANLVLECRKMYTDPLHEAAFLDPAIVRNYPNRDFHQLYFGEVLAVSGDRALYC